MGTRSTIALEYKDGTIGQIYCHWDGYLDHNGDILRTHYTSVDAINQLIELGDMSSLGTNITSTSDHSFDKPQKDVCVFYGRDRGEPDVGARHYKNLDDFLKNSQNEEYNYLFKDGKWYVQCEYKFPKFIPLEEAFELDLEEDCA